MIWTGFSLRLSQYFGALSFFANSKCVHVLHWGEYWVMPHTAIKPILMECCSDVCPGVDFSYLHIWSCSSTRVTISVLVTTPTKALLHQLLSLASSKKSPVCFKLLLLRVTETTCFCETSMQQNCFLNSSPDVWFDANLFLSSTVSS